MNSKISVLIIDDDQVWRDRLLGAADRDPQTRVFEYTSVESYNDALILLASSQKLFTVAVIDICLDKNNKRNEDGFLLADLLQKRSTRTRFIFVGGTVSAHRYKQIIQKYPHAEVLEKEPEEETFVDAQLSKAVLEASKKAEFVDVFVMMPFREEYRGFYLSTVKPFFETMYTACRRADEFFQPGIVMRDIMTYIEAASFSVADLSGANPNVVLEVGIAHALEKNVILLTRDKKSIPDIIEPIRWFTFHENHPDDLRETLARAVEELQRKNYPALFRRENLAAFLPGKCIVLAPHYGSEPNALSEIIRPVLDSRQYEVIDLLNDVHSEHRIENYWSQISQANIVIADLTNLDLNVFYLTGFAYGLDKPIIFISDDKQKVPFDLKNCTHILYPGDSAEEAFQNAINDLRKSGKLPALVVPAGNAIPVLASHSPATKHAVDILLVTANGTECETVIAEIVRRTGAPSALREYPENTYHDFGLINNYHVLMVQTEEGGIPTTLTVDHCINELKPKRIILVGCAFGINPEEQRLYDVLVSKQIVYYDLQRISMGGGQIPVSRIRGDRAGASQRLLKHLRAVYASIALRKRRYRTHFGLVLSGDKLVDNIVYRNQLYGLEPDAIGGEMEGAGFYFAAKENHVDWILVKGISDWADGSKKANGQTHQRKATRNALDLVFRALEVPQA